MEISSDTILDNGTRVWVWDPFRFGPKSKAGKITGFNINFEAARKLLGLPGAPHSKPYMEYQVCFGPSAGTCWIHESQITGWLAGVK